MKENWAKYFDFSGIDDDLYATSTVIIMERLMIGDQIYAEMQLDGDHGRSLILSDKLLPSIHFVGHKIAD